MISRWLRLGTEEEGVEGEARVPVGVDMMLRGGATVGRTAAEAAQVLYKI
jgi:hypothetical protein